jgi:hypothetical protein
MLDSDYFDMSYWLDLADTKLPIKEVGMSRCKDWCLAALEIDKIKNLFSIHEANLGLLVIDLYWHPTLVHFWLEAHNHNKIYVADGHAGQYDKSFLRGFYGYLEDASAKLQEVYSKRI